MQMKHYIVLLEPVSKQNDFNKAQDYIKKEGENAEKMIKIIKDTMKVYGLEREVRKIDHFQKAGSPVLSVECTEKALQRMLQIKGVAKASEDGRYYKNAQLVEKKAPPKPPTFFDLLFKRRKGRGR